MHFIIWWLSLALASASQVDWGEDHAALVRLRERCRLHRVHLTLDASDYPRKGQLDFFPLGVYESAQGRFSYRRLKQTLTKARSKMITYTRGRKVYSALRHDHHRSAYGLDKPALGILYRGKIYLTDGNHKAITSHALSASRMPGEIIETWDDAVEPDEFRAQMEARGLGWWRDYNGEAMPPRDLCDLINDPNLFLARLNLRRTLVAFESGHARLLRSDGARRAIAIKINNDQAFLEMKIGDALHRAGRHWSDAYPSSQLTLGEQVRDLARLKAAALDPSSGLGNILFLDRPSRHPNLESLIQAHVARHGCENYLLHGVSE